MKDQLKAHTNGYAIGLNDGEQSILDQLHKQVEGLPFARMDLGKNWDAGEWISRKDVLTLIKERMG